MNHADAIMVAGRYQTRLPLPFSPGIETVGLVVACGRGVTRFSPGDRVMAILPYGGLAGWRWLPGRTSSPFPRV